MSDPRELIRLVKDNPILYDRGHKDFIDAKKKPEVWAYIGSRLTDPITGEEAEKKFYGLRQRFGKERRKVREAETNSRNSGHVDRYNSSWPYYEEMMFLLNFVTPRRPSSRHVFNRLKVEAEKSGEIRVQDILNVDQEMQSAANSDDSSPASPITTLDVIDYSPTEEYESGKKNDETEVLNLIHEQSKDLESLLRRTHHLIAGHVSKESSSETQYAEFMGAINFAFRKVPQSKQLSCLVGVLNYINQYSEDS